MKKPIKKPKQKSLGTIHKRLLRLWSEAVRGRTGFACELCGIKRGEINKGGKPEKIDAHHFLSKEIKDCPLKYDIRNGVSVDPFCHKFGIPSFHRDPVRTITWLQNNRPSDYEFIRDHADIRVDLDNRKVLEEIEIRLRAKEPLNLDRLIDIEKRFPRKTRSNIELEGNLFEQLAEPKTDLDSL
jgi:hypothetical protein